MPPKGGPLPAAELDVLRGWVGRRRRLDHGRHAVSPPRTERQGRTPRPSCSAKLATVEKLEIFPPEVRLETKPRLPPASSSSPPSRMPPPATSPPSPTSRSPTPKVAALRRRRASSRSPTPAPPRSSRLARRPAPPGSRHRQGRPQGPRGLLPSRRHAGLPPRPTATAGGCHGAARGKDGFRLSLFGMDPDGDYVRLTRELIGRRINLAIPEESTLVEKAVGAVPHSGNKLYEPDSAV